jgi:hypothetical protein
MCGADAIAGDTGQITHLRSFQTSGQGSKGLMGDLWMSLLHVTLSISELTESAHLGESIKGDMLKETCKSIQQEHFTFRYLDVVFVLRHGLPTLEW